MLEILGVSAYNNRGLQPIFRWFNDNEKVCEKDEIRQNVNNLDLGEGHANVYCIILTF